MSKFAQKIKKNFTKAMDEIALQKKLETTDEVVLLPLSIIDRTVEPFKSLNPVDEAQRTRIRESMVAHGFLKTNPLIAWRKKEGRKYKVILTEGFSRSAVAEALGIQYVWVVLKGYASEEEAVKEARHQEYSRRHDRPEDLFRHFEALNFSKFKDEPGRLNECIARELGISPRQAQKWIKISKEADEATKEALRTGKISTDNAIQSLSSTQTKPKKEKARTFWDGVEYALEAIASGKTPECIRAEAQK